MDRVEYEKSLIQKIISSIKCNGGDRYLSSIILTGSFGRGEPTYSIDTYGNFQLKSDIEIALIYPKSVRKRDVLNLIKCVSEEFNEDLNLMPLTEKRVRKGHNFNFSLKEPRYKTIFTYDLYNGSYTIWGKDFISQKQILLDSIDIYEAKRIVANRIAELCYLCNNSKTKDIEYITMQWKGKVLLAIASAFLICQGMYKSSYRKQFDCIINNKDSVEKVLGDGFVEEYKKVFEALRENGSSYEVQECDLMKYVERIDNIFQNNLLKKSRVNNISRYIKYIIKYIVQGQWYGLFNYENEILSSVIKEYYNGDNKLLKTSRVWYQVLH